MAARGAGAAGRHGAWRAGRRCLATPPDQCIAAPARDWIAFSEAAPRQKRRRFCAVSCFNGCVTWRQAKPRQPGRTRHKRNPIDRKSTRLNSSHTVISYAVFCLKKKKNTDTPERKQIKG